MNPFRVMLISYAGLLGALALYGFFLHDAVVWNYATLILGFGLVAGLAVFLFRGPAIFGGS